MKPIPALLISLSALGLAISLARAAEAKKPNIVYILADDMGHADAGFSGGKQIQTPNLNALAKQGTTLSSFYVQPVCSPPRASLMTGRYVAHTGVYTVIRPRASKGLPLAERTLAQALREAGYATAISGKWHLGESQPGYLPTRRGFDHQYGLRFGNIDYFTQPMHIMDWYPTLVKLAGGSLKQALPLDGKNIWSVLVAGAKSPHDALLLSGTAPGKAAVRAGDWKLVHGEKDDESGGNEDFLFNLADDLGERNNLAASRPEKLAEMKALLNRLLKDSVPSWETAGARGN